MNTSNKPNQPSEQPENPKRRQFLIGAGAAIAAGALFGIRKIMSGDNRENQQDRSAETTESVEATQSEKTTETMESASEKNLTPVSFSELSALLAPKGINLAEELDMQIQRELDRGHITEEEIESYKARFETIHVHIDEIQDISEGDIPMLFIDDMTPLQAVDKLLRGTGITVTDGLNGSIASVENFKRVDPEKRIPEKNQQPSGLARLTFTPNMTNVEPTLPDDDFMSMRKERHFIQPQQWCEMFRRGLENGMKELGLGNGKSWKDMTREEKYYIFKDTRIDAFLPDSTQMTVFPEWRIEREKLPAIDMSMFWRSARSVFGPAVEISGYIEDQENQSIRTLGVGGSRISKM